MRHRILLLALVVILCADAVHAQVRTVPQLSRAGARQVLGAAEAEARRNGWAVSIAVTDPAGQLLAFVRLDDAPPASVTIAMGKARTAALFRRPSRAIEELAATRVGFTTIDGIMPIEGGVPIIAGDRVVGAIGVSGATSAQDGQVATAGAAAATGDANQSVPLAAAPIHQLRVYEIFDQTRDAFHARFRDHAMRIMARHGFRVAATWESRRQAGTEFVYLLEWPDTATMRQAWTAFLADTEWAAVKRETNARERLVGDIEDRTMWPTPYSPAPAPDRHR